MITPIRGKDEAFSDAVAVINRSGAAELIETHYEMDRLPGGRVPTGIVYSIRAVLVAALMRIIECTPPTYSGILTTLAGLDPEHLAMVDMEGQDLTALRENNHAEYKRFHAWLDRRLAPLDPGADLPARRVTNADHRAALDKRTPADRQRVEAATSHIRTVVNRIVAASIHTAPPPAYQGDLVADESIYDLAGQSAGLGMRPEKNRGAAYCGRYYVRDKSNGQVRTELKGREIRKAAFGIGLTAVTRVGPPEGLHAVAPVIVGIDIHEPTSASVAGLRAAFDGMRENHLDHRRSERARWPHLTIDMGYNPKHGFAELMLDYRYSAVARYPKSWGLTYASVDPRPGPRTQPGPVQIAGAFYCPAAVEFTRKYGVPATRRLLADKDFGLHDDRLRRLLPFLMGTNSRPFRARTSPGHPRLGEAATTRIKQELVCPAAMGRVRCPLKPASMTETPIGTPTANPTWNAEDHTCCAKSSVTVTFTPKQLRMAQWNLVPGSWEHGLYFEAARALTEQRFSLLKSPHITGIADVKWGPRREPMIKINLALAVAATNLRIQARFDPRKARAESIDIRWRQLRADLGHEPMRIPPRT